jgi:hypothetical protein
LVDCRRLVLGLDEEGEQAGVFLVSPEGVEELVQRPLQLDDLSVELINQGERVLVLPELALNGGDGVLYLGRGRVEDLIGGSNIGFYLLLHDVQSSITG